MAIGSAFGISTTHVSTTQDAPLGFEVVKQSATGQEIWVYVFNDEASTAFSAGQIIYRDPSATTYDYWGGLITPVDVHQPKVMVLGVAQHAIAAGSFGFILVRGVGSITAGGAHLTADAAFTSGGATVAGRAITYADGTNSENIAVIGHTAAQINTTTTGSAWIDCR
tara:strand:+ start:10045 stop:10545 length:501 start_codon:yes stop_codon:yes gene_type:complete